MKEDVEMVPPAIEAVYRELDRPPRVQVADPDAIDIGDGTSLTLLQAVYRNRALPLPVRLRAANMALPFEHGKLTVIANADYRDFAERLEQAIERRRLLVDEPRVIEAQPKAVGHIMRR
jgi:hypothetical protein